MGKSVLVCVLAASGALTGFSGSAVADDSGARPGDDAMTCEQIAVEMQPYAESMRGSITALGATNEQLMQLTHKQMARDAPRVNATTQAAGAACGFVGGPACMAATKADEANRKQIKEQETAEAKPLADQELAQSSALAAQGTQLQSNARLNRLMQLGHAKGCDRGHGH